MGKQTHSPWAIKKINSKCAKSQMTVYQKRLTEEAKILKDLHHPNIVGKYFFKILPYNAKVNMKIISQMFFMIFFPCVFKASELLLQQRTALSV